MFQFFKKFIRRKKLVVIVLRGATSTGKTATAWEIQKKLSDSFILSIDNIIAMNVPQGLKGEERINAWIRMRPFGHELTDVLVSHLLRKEKNVIIEEVLPDVARVKEIVGLANLKDTKAFVFELTAPLEIIEKREKMRQDPNPEKPVKELIELLAGNPFPGAIKIDSSQFSPKECAQKILEYIEKNV